MSFIACADEKRSKEMYNPIIDLDFVVAVDRSNNDTNDYRIMFHMHDQEQFQWLFDTLQDRDDEYMRIQGILLSIT